jgi:hypothetical protein
MNPGKTSLNKASSQGRTKRRDSRDPAKEIWAKKPKKPKGV